MNERSAFLPWPSIGKLSDVRYHAKGRDSKVRYNAKIKLHGTNAAIRVDSDGTVTAQSRSRDLGVGKDDNFGFAAWVSEHSDKWLVLPSNYILYGEWVGPGIQNGVALASIPERHFAVFAVFCGEAAHAEPEYVRTFVPDFSGISVLPWFFAKDFEIDFDAPSQEVIEMINSKVESIDGLCPWAKERYGIEGPGEGLCFYARQ